MNTNYDVTSLLTAVWKVTLTELSDVGLIGEGYNKGDRVCIA